MVTKVLSFVHFGLFSLKCRLSSVNYAQKGSLVRWPKKARKDNNSYRGPACRDGCFVERTRLTILTMDLIQMDIPCAELEHIADWVLRKTHPTMCPAKFRNHLKIIRSARTSGYVLQYCLLSDGLFKATYDV